MLPIDLTEIVESILTEGRRENDYQLHPSGHMLGSLRHAQLDVAGAPRTERNLASLIRMEIGTQWHERLAQRLQKLGVPVMSEVTLTPWLPKGWAGTCDLLVWNPEFKAFALVDLKTIKGDGVYWIKRDGAKQEHVWQTSLYWHGCKAMGIPLIKRVGIYYLPVSEARKGSEPATPEFAEFDPLPWETMQPVVEGRWKSVSEYLDSLPFDPREGIPEAPDPRDTFALSNWVTDKLAPVQERVF